MSAVLSAQPRLTPTVTVAVQPVCVDDREQSQLSDGERQLAARLTDPERRRSFVAGRCLAHQAVADHFGESGMADNSPAEDTIEILSHDATGVTSRPVIVRNGIITDEFISITHHSGMVAVAVSGESIGIDLAEIRPLSSGFRRLWLSGREQLQVARSEEPAVTATMNWSAREAAFKATQVAEEFQPGSWSITFETEHTTCCYQGRLLPVALNFFHLADNLLLTVASSTSAPARIRFSPVGSAA